MCFVFVFFFQTVKISSFIHSYLCACFLKQKNACVFIYVKMYVRINIKYLLIRIIREIKKKQDNIAMFSSNNLLNKR